MRPAGEGSGEALVLQAGGGRPPIRFALAQECTSGKEVPSPLDGAGEAEPIRVRRR